MTPPAASNPNAEPPESSTAWISNYRIDDFQQVYFVIDSFDELFEATLQDFGPVYEALKEAGDLAITDIIESDKVYTRGTQDYAKKRAATAAQ